MLMSAPTPSAEAAPAQERAGHHQKHKPTRVERAVDIAVNQKGDPYRYGAAGPGAALGRVLGPSFARADVPGVIEKLIGCYLERRDSEAERFVDLVHRVGIEPFKESVYGNADQRAARRTRERAFA